STSKSLRGSLSWRTLYHSKHLPRNRQGICGSRTCFASCLSVGAEVDLIYWSLIEILCRRRSCITPPTTRRAIPAGSGVGARVAGNSSESYPGVFVKALVVVGPKGLTI